MVPINKPPDFGIIIPGLQVVETGFSVEVVASVAVGVDFGNGCVGGLYGDFPLALRVILPSS